jgi:hypothetical protein
MKDWFKKIFMHSPVKYVVLLILGLLIILANLLLNGFDHFLFYLNGVQIAGLSIVLMGGLSMLGYVGAFDFWGYTFSKKEEDGRRIPISQYIEIKNSKRQRKNIPFTPYFLVGAAYLIISFILLLVF